MPTTDADRFLAVIATAREAAAIATTRRPSLASKRAKQSFARTAEILRQVSL